MFNRINDATEMRKYWLEGLFQYGMNLCHTVQLNGKTLVKFVSFFRKDFFYIWDSKNDVQYFVEPKGIPSNCPEDYRKQFIREVKANEELVLKNIHFLDLYEKEKLWREIPFSVEEAIERLETLLAHYNCDEAVELFNKADFGYKI